MRHLPRSKCADIWEREMKESTLFGTHFPDAVAYWDQYAPKYDEAHVSFHASVLGRVLGRICPGDEVLDIGAGTGALTIPIARKAKSVLAIEPAPGMRERLNRKISESSLTNVKVLDSRWEDAVISGGFDCIFSSLTLYFLSDIQKSLEKMVAIARERLCFLVIARDKEDLYGKIWSIVNGRPYRPGPDYSCLVNLLEDLGLSPAVEIIETHGKFQDLRSAMQSVIGHLDQLQIMAKEAEIRSVITPLLERQEDGRLLWKGMHKSALITARVGTSELLCEPGSKPPISCGGAAGYPSP